MKNSIFYSAIAFVVFASTSACQKSSSSGATSTALIGKWQLVNFVATVKDSSSSSSFMNSYFTTNTSNSLITEIDVDGGGYQDTVYTHLLSEVWAFSASNTYSINEIFNQYSPGSSSLINDTASGTGSWNYLGSGNSVNSFVLLGGITSAFPIATTFTIQSNATTQLILNYSGTQTMGSELVSINETLTFNKIN